MKNRLVVFRYIAFALEMILLAVLQSTPKLMPEIFGSKPLLLVAAALCFAGVEEVVPSTVLGAVCGVIADLSGTGRIGFFAVALTLCCYGISHLMNTRLRSNLFTLMLLSLGGVILIIGLYFVFFRLLAGVPDSGILFVNHYISRILYTYVCIVPLYFLNSFLKRRLT